MLSRNWKNNFFQNGLQEHNASSAEQVTIYVK